MIALGPFNPEAPHVCGVCWFGYKDPADAMACVESHD